MLSIEPLTIDDAQAAMRLVEQAGWNQTPADWQRVIAYQPWGCFKATRDGQLVGTVTSTSYGQELAWIGMMLVDTHERRQGIGRALMNRVVAQLQQTQVRTIKLDATPLGQPLYEQLGFAVQNQFERWRRAEIGGEAVAIETKTNLEPMHLELDRRAFGLDRSHWLRNVATTRHCLMDDNGFGMIRSGRVADYLGPIVAATYEVAETLISPLVASTTSTIFWDMPNPDSRVVTLAKSLGFEPVRSLTRMVLGQDTTEPRLDLQYAICDPACG